MPSAGTPINRSVTVTTTAQNALGVNQNRYGWYVRNDTPTDVYISFVGNASAAFGLGNILVTAGGGSANSLDSVCETTAMSIICGSGTAAVTIYEY